MFLSELQIKGFRLFKEPTSIPFLYGCSVNLGKIRAGEAKGIVLETFENTHDTSIPCEIETIHSCKGMSLDAVLFMSAYKQSHDQDSGSHWFDWFASDSNFYQRGESFSICCLLSCPSSFCLRYSKSAIFTIK